MPNKLTDWNVEHKSGNSTRSVLVNELIMNIKKYEVRKEGGGGDDARRPMGISEFREFVSRCRNSSSFLNLI